MNNYYELIYLIEELKVRVKGTYFSFAISPHKDVLEMFIETDSKALRIIFSTNPSETALFIDQYRPPKKSNVIEFFKQIEDKKIVDIELAHHDRLVYFYFDDEFHLLFKLFSSNPNVFFVRNNKIVDAFKNPDDVVGQQPPEPYAPSFSDEVNSEAKPKNQRIRCCPVT